MTVAINRAIAMKISEMWSHSGYVLKIEPIRFLEGLWRGKTSNFNNWKNEAVIYLERKDLEGSRDENQAFSYMSLEFKRQIQTGDKISEL